MILIKVRESLNNPTNIRGMTGRDEKSVSSNKGASFQSHMKRAESHNAEERIRELIGMISEQGEKLAQKVDIRELKKYKLLISQFMDEAVSNSHEFSKRSLLDRRGRHKVYAVVKKVDEELEKLTGDILNGEKDNIKILQRLDDIRGLILDLVM